MEKPICELIGEDGNIFNLMGKASKTLKRAGLSDKVDEMINKVKQSKSYSQALNVIGEYVEIITYEIIEEE